MDAGRVKQRFGARLRKLRKAKGLTQESLALVCDLDRSYVGAIERGESNVSLINIHRLAEGLKLKPGELFGDLLSGWQANARPTGTSRDRNNAPLRVTQGHRGRHVVARHREPHAPERRQADHR